MSFDKDGNVGTRKPADVKADQVVALTPLIRQVLRGRLSDDGHLEDLTQDCLAQLLDARGRLSPDTLAGYAVVTARNLAISHGRRLDRSRRHLPRLVDLRTPDDPADEVVRAEEISALRVALDRLPNSERVALIAHDVHGVDTASLGTESQTAPGGVASRLHRTRAKLRVDYVVALQGTTPLPSSRCRAVLVAVSNADRRRQAALNAGEHLTNCPTCATLSIPLVERRRGAVVLLPVSVIVGRLLRPAHKWVRTHPAHAAAGSAVAAGVAAVLVAATASGSHKPLPGLPPAVMVAKPTTPASPPAGTPKTGKGTSLLGLGNGSAAQPEVGQMVTGTNVIVQPPIDLKDGFWVGDSPSDSYFVDLADSLTTIPSGPVMQLNQGQPVSFTGQLVANTPQYLAEARSDAIPGIDKIAAQGYHIASTAGDIHPYMRDRVGR